MTETTHSTRDAAPVLDPAALERLRELGREIGRDDFLAHMATTFLETLVPLARFEEMIANGDQDGLVDVAHALKGNSASFGALGLATLAGALEDAAAAGRVTSPWPPWDAFADEYRRVEAALRELVNE